jgi:DNA-directed RNA polymerase sigma subunit (sigma70/sigma32)
LKRPVEAGCGRVSRDDPAAQISPDGERQPRPSPRRADVLKVRRPATLTELAAEVEMSENKVTEGLRFAAEPLSLAQPLGADSEAELADLIEDKTKLSPLDAALLALPPSDVAPLLDLLDDRERQIISLRFGLDRGEPHMLEEIGEHFNVTRERIRQIEGRAISKLQHPSAGTGARDLLDA